MTKIFILGLDGAPPKYILKEWKDKLPTISKLMDTGTYAVMNSTIPPSTIIAWSSFLSGKDASDLCIYDYMQRTHDSVRITNSNDVKCERLWDILGKSNKKGIFLNVPLTYPVMPINGIMVSDFLTPSFNNESVYPLEFKDEIKEVLGEDYMFDVSVGLASYKNIKESELIESTYKMTRQTIQLIHHVIDNKEWDVLMVVMIGTDRMQHRLWSFLDPTHRSHKPNSEFKDSILNYYIFIDSELAKIISKLDDDTVIIVASDHGFDKMDGRINLNDFLIKNGYLVLKEMPNKPTKLDVKNIDWTKTKAYTIGAYFGRISFNKKKPSGEGIVSEEECKILQDELIKLLSEIKDDKGRDMDTKFFKTQEIYAGKYADKAPDLYIYFDNLRWGVNNDVGNEGLYSWSTVMGGDDAGHAPQGVFIINGKDIPKSGLIKDINITDVTPTLLPILGIKDHPEMGGKNIFE